jgi:hypothetical protein
MAAIDFLTAELCSMQSKTPSPVMKEDEYLATSEATSFCSDNRSRRGSTSSRQSTSNTTPTTFDMRDSSQVAPTTTPSIAMVVTPPVIDSAQQFVFSVVDGRSMKPKTKRRMTREEKVEYKTTRKHGACPTCRRQKGKVCHTLMYNLKSKAYSMGTVHSCRKYTFSRGSIETTAEVCYPTRYKITLIGSFRTIPLSRNTNQKRTRKTVALEDQKGLRTCSDPSATVE